MKFLALITLLPLAAQVKKFVIGQYLPLTARYDAKTDRFAADVHKGRHDIRLRIDAVAENGITLTLLKGTYRPWWSETVIYKPGDYADKWSTSDTYRRSHPNANTIDGLLGLLTAHAACP